MDPLGTATPRACQIRLFLGSFLGVGATISPTFGVQVKPLHIRNGHKSLAIEVIFPAFPFFLHLAPRLLSKADVAFATLCARTERELACTVITLRFPIINTCALGCCKLIYRDYVLLVASEYILKGPSTQM